MKKAENTLKMQFDSLSQNESLARSLAAAFVMQLNPTVAELADIKCAVSEAVTNCTVHAYRDAVGPVYMTMHTYSDRKIKIEIRDAGCGIPDVEAAMQPPITPLMRRRAQRHGLHRNGQLHGWPHRTKPPWKRNKGDNDEKTVGTSPLVQHT